MNPRVKTVKPTDDYQLILEFTNGECGLYDCKPLLNFGVFRELQDINYFKQVAVIDGTVTWINEQDICPDTLYLESKMIDDEITEIWDKLIKDINEGTELCSSEKSLVFHFAWRLKDRYKNEIKLDFEYDIFKSISGNKWLDLYAILDSQKLGFEFKFKGNTNTTDTHIDVIHDIKRLCWLKSGNRIDKGYFLYATDSKSAINQTCKSGSPRKKCLQFVTHHGAEYKTQNAIFPIGCTGTTKSIEIVSIPHDITFHWEEIIFDNSKEYAPKNTYSWLKPIIIT